MILMNAVYARKIYYADMLLQRLYNTKVIVKMKQRLTAPPNNFYRCISRHPSNSLLVNGVHF